MKIFLIGLPGSGKTTLSRELADRMQLPFLDLDTEIERREANSVQQLFAMRGETYFRTCESEVLATLCKSEQSFVLSTGGGTPCFHHNMDVMKSAGLTIYLNVSAEELHRRLSRSNLRLRPLFTGLTTDGLLQKITSLKTTRDPFYKQASLTLSGDHLSVDDLIAAITAQSQM